MKIRLHRSLVFLSLASFAAGISIGYVKFFILGHLSEVEHSPADKAWIIQLVGSLITLGPCLTFVIGGPLASAFHKSKIMFAAGCAVAVVMAFGASTSWLGSGWLYVFLAGLGLGLFNAARNSAIPLESYHEGISTEFVNACVNNLYIVGLLLGVPLGTELYLFSPHLGGWITCLLFVVGAFLGLECKIKDEAQHLRTFNHALNQLSHDCKKLFQYFHYYLFISPMLWGVAGALSLAATAFVEECKFAGPLAASLMSVYAAFGVVAGNSLATKLQTSRFQSATKATLVLGLSIVLIPVLGWFDVSLNQIPHLGYILVSLLLLSCGFSFGCATNLIEAEYLTKIYHYKLEGTGAALMSAMTSVWAFLLGGLAALAVLAGVLNSSTQFVALAAITCVIGALISKLKKLNQTQENPPIVTLV